MYIYVFPYLEAAQHAVAEVEGAVDGLPYVL
jgi:hypothetical protein